MIDWYKKVVFENYANFNGRARRSEYWWFTLAHVIIVTILTLLDNGLGLTFGSGNSGILKTIYSLLIFIPSMAVAVRRLHDVGKSGWLLLILYGTAIVFGAVMFASAFATGMGGIDYGAAFIIPLLGIFAIGIWMLILFFTEGDRGPNKYGPDPKGVGEEINEIGME
ncbi:MAG: DUF805 domain-containing protein [Flavobacterium sp. JAD_PAG50586_2]|nr:MAG: DUF805 domain-containing protein [Flavobacterium sp. JAD_PAG50586_2]